MALWSHPPRRLLDLIGADDFRFITAQDPIPYLVILVELFRRRQEQRLELPFDRLLDAVQPALSSRISGTRDYGTPELRADLCALEEWGNVRQRLEPRRIRRLQDRGLERYLVRLTDGTHDLLERLDARAARRAGERESGARDHLRDLEDALGRVAEGLGRLGELGHEGRCRLGRDVQRAQAASEAAGADLLRLELRLGELALETLDAARLEELVTHIQSYLERYLQDLDRRRRRALELLSEPGHAGLDTVHEALLREAAEDPLSSGRPPSHPGRGIELLGEFLREGGVLDRRCQAVHQRTADVAGHLERHLAALVRRSQLRACIRDRVAELARLDASPASVAAVDAFFTSLWQSGHLVGAELPGTPARRAAPPRPRRRYERRRPTFGGAVVSPADGEVAGRRPLLQTWLEALGEFVEERILRGRRRAPVTDARLESFADVRLLVSAVRVGLTSRAFHRRYLTYRVERRAPELLVTLEPSSGAGRLRLLDVDFVTGAGARHG
jgi:hypothetical protein